MAGSAELRRLWRKYREFRTPKKQRSSQASSGSSSRDSKGSMALEEATSMMVGLGLDTKQEEEYVEHALDDDPRFVNNPHGIGCSRTYEVPHESVTNSLSTSPASMRPLVPRETNMNESDELLSFPKLGSWKTESIDMVKGKRKGRMPGDSADDRYKFLLDGPASSRAKSTAKRFTLVRERAWTR
ncbi:MAG: hypothetical protein Q9161_009052 [Pseudevernia consocians]